MKRYERMSKEEINNAYYSCTTSNCSKCIANKYCNDTIERVTCVERVYDWLQKEIKMKKVHRYELIKSPEDVDKILKEHGDVCAAFDGSCRECKYNKPYYCTSSHCFANFLKEEIEIEVEDE